MVGFNSVGQKKFIGIGNSFSSSDNANFLIARYIPVNPPDTAAVRLDNFSEKFSVYPNPASGFVYLRTSNEIIKSASIVDALGRRVRSFDHLERTTLSGSTTLDLSDLSNGVYIVIAQTANGVSTSRLSVNR
jgi:hypothetical protein